MNSKSIICLEPWDGAGISKMDTGLGNRIIHWSILYYISCIFKNCKIVVEKKYWPELDFLELPNTDIQDIDYDDLKNNSKRLLSQDIQEIIYNKNLDSFDSFCSYYSDTYILLPNEILIKGIKKIKFKDKNINNFFQNNFSNFYSLHLRRGLGTIPSTGYIKDFLFYKDKSELKEYLNEYYFSGGYWYWGNTFPKLYTIVSDSVYFKIVDEVISINKEQKFYISSDIHENYYSYYFDKYPYNFVKIEDRFEEFLNLCNYDESMRDESITYPLKQTLRNLFDLFVLSHSQGLIMDSSSTWGTVSSLIFRQKQVINLIEYILRKDSISYKEFVEKYSYKKILVSPWSKFMM